jgi:hypothetical protein
MTFIPAFVDLDRQYDVVRFVTHTDTTTNPKPMIKSMQLSMPQVGRFVRCVQERVTQTVANAPLCRWSLSNRPPHSLGRASAGLVAVVIVFGLAVLMVLNRYDPALITTVVIGTSLAAAGMTVKGPPMSWITDQGREFVHFECARCTSMTSVTCSQ